VTPKEETTKASGKAQKTHGNERLGMGVYARVARVSSNSSRLKSMEDICLHNADVSESLGERSKMETWKLVAKIVRNRMNQASDGLDGWGGFGGGALSAVILGNVLSYFEALGDVQMLSTLVCVLRASDTEGHEQGCSFLPRDQDARYDRYLFRYADLLYGWGLLTIRIEVIKHLSKPMLPDKSSATDHTFGSDLSGGGLAFVFACPQCADTTESGYCRSCNGHTLRCAICDNAVRGLFTSCDR
jgi:hypothetical protein